MANQRGRPVPPLFLSAEERDYLERQVRRHSAPRFGVPRVGLAWSFTNDGCSPKQHIGPEKILQEIKQFWLSAKPIKAPIGSGIAFEPRKRWRRSSGKLQNLMALVARK